MAEMKKKIRVGLDFDGVVAYNPMRIFRAWMAFIKRRILRIKKLRFWYPKYSWQKFLWIIIHESSIFPSAGCDLLAYLAEKNLIEFHLVTARYSFLDDSLRKWLKKYKIEQVFKTINLNIKDEQPHIFKEKIIDKYRFDYFIEDNFDIINYLSPKNPSKIYWIYNIFDRWYDYPEKYPYLEKALRAICQKEKIKIKAGYAR